MTLPTVNIQVTKRERPWGWYKTIHRGEGYRVKMLYIKPGQRLSLQYHKLRTEDWVIVQGTGVVTQGNLDSECKVGDTFHIGVEMRHRVKSHDDGLLICETQLGKCKEDDIVRLEDDYGRVKKDNIYMCMNEYGTE